MDCVGAVCVWHRELALQRAIECTRAPTYYCKQVDILAYWWAIFPYRKNLLQMLDSKTLHPYGFIVAHVVVEGVALATKVIHNGLWTQWGHHLGIVPRKSQMILWSWCHLPVRHGQGSCTCTFLTKSDWQLAGADIFVSADDRSIQFKQWVSVNAWPLIVCSPVFPLSRFVYKLFIACTLPILKCCTLSICLYLIYLLCNIYFSVANRTNSFAAASQSIDLVAFVQ